MAAASEPGTPAGEACRNHSIGVGTEAGSRLVIALTFPTPGNLAAPSYEPRNVASRWQQRIAEQVQRFGASSCQVCHYCTSSPLDCR